MCLPRISNYTYRYGALKIGAMYKDQSFLATVGFETWLMKMITDGFLNKVKVFIEQLLIDVLRQ